MLPIKKKTTTTTTPEEGEEVEEKEDNLLLDNHEDHLEEDDSIAENDDSSNEEKVRLAKQKDGKEDDITVELAISTQISKRKEDHNKINFGFKKFMLLLRR